jgi:hypothetical protein
LKCALVNATKRTPTVLIFFLIQTLQGENSMQGTDTEPVRYSPSEIEQHEAKLCGLSCSDPPKIQPIGCGSPSSDKDGGDLPLVPS